MITRTIGVDVDKDGLLWVFAQNHQINLKFCGQRIGGDQPLANVYSCTAESETMTLLALTVPLIEE